MEDTRPTIKAVQQAVGVDADGIAGPKTWAAIYSKLGLAGTPAEPNHISTGYVFDSRSEANINSLTPAAQKVARQFLHDLLDAGIRAKIISGTRSPAEQNALYEQGRTKPGKIVTNARAGYSNHNFGIAFDIGIFSEDGAYLEESHLYAHAATFGKKLGLSWGGDWKFQDEPHYELRPEWAKDMSESEMLAKLRADNPGLAA